MKQFRSCIHIKVNGIQCGSPAMRGDLRCYFHYHQLKPITRLQGFATLASQKGRTLALDQVFRALAAGRIDPEVAQSMLYAIQIATQA